MTASLKDKVVILTGASGGQGRIAARMFAEAGARVVMTDRDGSGVDIAASIGSSAIFVAHDVSSPDDWRRVTAAAEQAFGGVDVLVNNAGLAGRDTIETLSRETLLAYLEVNAIGALNGIHSVTPMMRRRGGGSIVNIGSIAALGATRGLAGYGISKWALRGMSRYAAVDLASSGIRVNLVLPGAVEVSMIRDQEASGGKQDVAVRTPLGRVAKVEEIVRVAIFLASDEASYITGAELTVDGGLTA